MKHTAYCCERGYRDNLEDTWLAYCLEWLGVLCIRVLGVFDGVGGGVYGEFASTVARYQAVAQVASALAAVPDSERAPILQIMKQAFEAANASILNAGAQDARLRGMATTAVLGIIDGPVLYAAWTGDSRMYVVEPGRIRRLTRDHSVIQAMRDAGLPDHRDPHENLHVITEFLGKADGMNIGTRICRLRPNTLVLLCSDGLTDVLSDAQLGALVLDHLDRYGQVDGLPEVLVGAALRAGTTDNVTVVCHLCQGLDQSTTLTPDQATFTGSYPEELAGLLATL